VKVGLETEDGFPHVGTIDFRDNQVDSGTGTVLLRGTLKNPSRRLVPGLFARVKMPIGKPQSWLLVPETSLAADQSGRYVLVVKDDGTVEQRPVELASNLGQRGFLAILTGITAEDRVIVSGLQKARPGGKVSPEDVEAEQFVSGSAGLAAKGQESR
jgi:RND family efflux transporter MFP subunit